jgi:hypothetical protein
MHVVLFATPDFGAGIIGGLAFGLLTVPLAIVGTVLVMSVFCLSTKHTNNAWHNASAILLPAFVSALVTPLASLVVCGIGLTDDTWWIPSTVGMLVGTALGLKMLFAQARTADEPGPNKNHPATTDGEDSSPPDTRIKPIDTRIRD